MSYNFSIPAIWSNKDLSYLNKKSNIGRVQEIYGALNGYFPTGRANDSLEITIDDVISHFNYANNAGFQTNYLLNGNIQDSNIKDYIEKYTAYFDWVFSDLKPTIVTVTDPRLIRFFVREYGAKRIKISAIAGIKSYDNLFTYLQNDEILEALSGVVLHHDVSVQINSNLKSFIKKLSLYEISPTVLVNESCFYGCKYRYKHYKHVGSAINASKNSFFDHYQSMCLIKRLLSPEYLLDLSGFIMPEMIPTYSRATGINSFKISGRSCTSNEVVFRTDSYLNGTSSSNVFDYVQFTMPKISAFEIKKISDIIYLNSSKYLDLLNECSTICNVNVRHKKYIKAAQKMYEEGFFYINKEVAEYRIQGEQLSIYKKGPYLNALINMYKQRALDKEICYT